LNIAKEKLLKNGFDECAVNIKALKSGELVSKPGCTPDESLESELNGILSKVGHYCDSLSLKTRICRFERLRVRCVLKNFHFTTLPGL
jgi:hypothetical protein